jgi:RHS repeat-associated protein
VYFFLFLFFLSPLVGEISSPKELSAFRREEDLIGGLISPQTGHIIQKNVDLFLPAKEPLYLHHSHQPNATTFFTCKRFETYCRPWMFFPHLWGAEEKGAFHLTDKNGCQIPYHEKHGKWDKLSVKHASILFTNTDGHEVHARFDKHNMYSYKTSDDKLCFCDPDGTKRIYKKDSNFVSKQLTGSCAFRLKKEILPNGKCIRYKYHKGELVSISSHDRKELVTYAQMLLTHDPQSSLCRARDGYSGTGALYSYTLAPIDFKNTQTGKVLKSSISLLTKVKSHLFPEETTDYVQPFSFILKQSGRDKDFRVSYGPDFRVAILDLYEDCRHRLFYEENQTTVLHPEGTRTVYGFTNQFQPEKMAYYDETGELRKEKTYSWEENGRLSSITYSGLAKTEYLSDSYGNPILETFIGDLEGYGEEDSYAIRRTFSGKDPNTWFLLLEEESEEAKTSYTYLPETNLVTSKIIKGVDGLSIEETRLYDGYYNLIQITVEAAGIKKVTKIHPKPQRPGLHEPYCIEEFYVENGEEKLLKKTYLEYDLHNLLAKETLYDAHGVFAHTTSKEHNNALLLIKEINPLGQKTEYTYDQRRRVTAITQDHIKEIRNYDLKGRITSQTMGDRTTKYSYDREDNVVSETNYLGQEKTFTYDLIAKKPKEIHFAGTIESFSYDGYGRLLSKTDSLGRITSYSYTAYDDPKEIIYPDGTKESFRYYKNGKLKEQTDREGLKTSFTYDSFGRMISKTFDNATEFYTYNALHLTSYTDREGHTTYYTYDKAGRKIEERKYNHTITYTYDSLSRIATITQGNLITSLEYDSLDRVIIETKSDLQGHILYKKTIVYDEQGNEHIVTVGDKEEKFFYDIYNRIIKAVDPLGNVTTISYKEIDIPEKTTTNSSDLRTIETYDPHNRLQERRIEEKEILSKERFTYDEVGNLIKHEEDVFEGSTYTKTLTSLYTYDVCNRRISSTISDRTTTYSYNAKNKIRQKIKADGTVLTYTYTPLGEVETIVSSKGDINYRYSYDKCGRLLAGNGFTRKLDPFGNIVEESFGSPTVYKTYDSLNRLTSLTIPGLEPITYTYDLYLTKVTYESESLSYKYDLAGHLIEDSHTKYEKDKKGQLTKLVTEKLIQECCYDSLGNPLQIGTTLYTYDPLSQITSEKDPLYENFYRFDSHYNDPREPPRTEANDPIGVYDSLDRLISCEGYTYSYDALDRRMTKKKKGVFFDTEESYLYHNLDEMACYSGNLLTAAKIGLPDHPAFLWLKGLLTLPLYDAKGSLRFVLHIKSHEILNQYLFDAFGKPIEVIEYLENPWRYALKHYDSESGLIYFTKRYYNPKTGRWITEDPAGDIDTLNFYAFVKNNPLRYTDYAGLYISFELTPFLSDNPDKLKNNLENSAALYETKGKLLPKSAKILVINGISNPLSYARESAEIIGQYAGGYQVSYIYNPTKGTAIDLMEYIFRAAYLYTPSRVVSLAVKTIEDFHRMNYNDPHARLFLQAHSGGCTEALHTSACLSPEARARVIYLGIAPSALLNEEAFHKVNQIGVKGDPVVKYARYNDLVHAINLRTFKRSDIELLNPMPGEDIHSVRSGVFKEHIQSHVEKYLKGIVCDQPSN